MISALLIYFLLQFAPADRAVSSPIGRSAIKRVNVVSSENGLSITLRPEFIDRTTKNGIIELSFSEATTILGDPGEPAIPAAVYTFGVPENSKPFITNISKKGGKSLSGQLSRIPNTIKILNDIPVLALDADGGVSNSDINIKTVRLEDAGYFRQQR